MTLPETQNGRFEGFWAVLGPLGWGSNVALSASSFTHVFTIRHKAVILLHLNFVQFKKEMWLPPEGSYAPYHPTHSRFTADAF